MVVVVPVVMVVLVFVPVLGLVLVLVLPVFFLLRTSERGVPVWVEGGRWGRFPIQYFSSVIAGGHWLFSFLGFKKELVGLSDTLGFDSGLVCERW